MTADELVKEWARRILKADRVANFDESKPFSVSWGPTKRCDTCGYSATTGVILYKDTDGTTYEYELEDYFYSFAKVLRQVLELAEEVKAVR